MQVRTGKATDRLSLRFDDCAGLIGKRHHNVSSGGPAAVTLPLAHALEIAGQDVKHCGEEEVLVDVVGDVSWVVAKLQQPTDLAPAVLGLYNRPAADYNCLYRLGAMWVSCAIA
ncbi:hypothetical protein K875_00045 [Mycobacterium [tuberculosis] TKK-01-0051]|uniref:Uncharacterized protein n=1 Tax=Mycobacterium [tuberculosis] TKK-01-0051 TaxID=1324261 RepID=A0A051UJT3_9MYCO|nr:hypothetical protein [Mycobacterium colombiense]KBZ69330.1 hypothetical protein K875_00045 [Mycobacterium [tuberculosis] TKK-01-0051]